MSRRATMSPEARQMARIKVDADLPTTRADAMASGSKFYCTGEPCVRGHVAPRKTNNRICMKCIPVTQDKHALKRYEATEKGKERNRQNQARRRFLCRLERHYDWFMTRLLAGDPELLA